MKANEFWCSWFNETEKKYSLTSQCIYMLEVQLFVPIKKTYLPLIFPSNRQCVESCSTLFGAYLSSLFKIYFLLSDLTQPIILSNTHTHVCLCLYMYIHICFNFSIELIYSPTIDPHLDVNKHLKLIKQISWLISPTRQSWSFPSNCFYGLSSSQTKSLNIFYSIPISTFNVSISSPYKCTPNLISLDNHYCYICLYDCYLSFD